MGILRSLVPKYDKGGAAMAYAILRFAKHKGGASKALSAHHERTKEIYASNPDTLVGALREISSSLSCP